MDTEKLYDRDAFLKEFDAVVTDCQPGKGNLANPGGIFVGLQYILDN